MLKTLTLCALVALAPPAFAHQPVTAGGLELTHGFTRATLPGAEVAGGFVTIRNTGATADRLTGGTAPFARAVELHEMSMQGDVMKMRRIEGGLEIAPGTVLELKSGAEHIMFMGLTQPLEEGKVVDVTLTFEHAGPVVVPLHVLEPGAKTGKH